VEVPEQVGVRDFSPSGEERMSLEMMKRRFSASVMAQVERTMSRNDKNKSGLLESDEIARSRWSNPTWQESDRDQDGKLSQLELAYRYEDREEAARKKLEARRSTGNRATSNRSTTNRGRIVSSRTRPRNYASARASRTDSETSNERTGFNSGSDSAYLRYAEGLMKSYDKDKDGRLSKTELEEMRRPPKNADADRDGFVDKLEMIASVKQRSGVGGNSSHTSASAEKLRRRASGAAFNQSDTVFGGKDLNGDRQLQMVEFSEDWSDDVVNEFEEKDSNGDGVITEAEWQAK